MRLVGFVHFLQDQLSDFFAKVIPESGWDYDPQGRHKSLTDVAGNFRHFWLLMDDDQEIRGTVAISDLPFDDRYAEVLHRNSGELKYLYLSKEYRGQGYGSKMVIFAIDQAKSFGYTWLYLTANSIKSGSAIEIYRHFGFQEIRRYKDDPEVDTFMRLKL